MIKKITIKKWRSGGDSLVRIDLQEVIHSIKNADYKDVVTNIRQRYPVLMASLARTQQEKELVFQDLDKVCFSSEMKNEHGQPKFLAYTGLIGLQISGLHNYEQAIRLRNQTEKLVYTRLAYLGADGRSVIVACQVGGMNDNMTREELDKFHTSACMRLHQIYSAQLGTTMDYGFNFVDDFFYLSADPDLIDCPDAETLQVNAMLEPTENPTIHEEQLEEQNAELFPGLNERQTWHRVFNYCAVEAISENRGLPREEFVNKSLYQLADLCRESALPKPFCVMLAACHPDLGRNEVIIQGVFDSVYANKREGKSVLKAVPAPALEQYRTEQFMRENYRLRMNVITRQPEYQKIKGFDCQWKQISKETQNSMTMEARRSGLNSWDKDLARYVNSDDIEQYDPINDYLEHLPRWDGKDRVDALSRRVPSDNPHWAYEFHIWMRSMVAHWMGRDLLHGNAQVPILVGDQGTRKTTFCSILLPPELSALYTDKIDCTNKTDVALSLSQHALINMDEFDMLKPSLQPLLKYILSTSKVETRLPHASEVTKMRRYASFMATTNAAKPLSDPTGSRRFICIHVTGDVDTETPIQYEQLYAQLRDEVLAGKIIYFDDEWTKIIMKGNEPFLSINIFSEMVVSLFTIPARGKEEKSLLLSEIIDIMKSHYHDMEVSPSTIKKISKCLTDLRCKSQHTRKGTAFFVNVKSADE